MWVEHPMPHHASRGLDVGTASAVWPLGHKTYIKVFVDPRARIVAAFPKQHGQLRLQFSGKANAVWPRELFTHAHTCARYRYPAFPRPSALCLRASASLTLHAPIFAILLSSAGVRICGRAPLTRTHSCAHSRTAVRCSCAHTHAQPHPHTHVCRCAHTCERAHAHARTLKGVRTHTSVRTHTPHGHVPWRSRPPLQCAAPHTLRRLRHPERVCPRAAAHH